MPSGRMSSGIFHARLIFREETRWVQILEGILLGVRGEWSGHQDKWRRGKVRSNPTKQSRYPQPPPPLDQKCTAKTRRNNARHQTKKPITPESYAEKRRKNKPLLWLVRVRSLRGEDARTEKKNRLTQSNPAQLSSTVPGILESPSYPVLDRLHGFSDVRLIRGVGVGVFFLG